VTFNARVWLSCGCVRAPRTITKEQIPEIGVMVHCISHGEVTVAHTAWVSN
jgi:hypothetical protein